MANFPSAGITLADDATLPEVIKALRFIATQQNRNIANSVRQVQADPRMKDERVAYALRSLAHNIEIVDMGRGIEGDVLYLVNRRQAAFGSPGNPGPGGTVPAAGNGPLLDAVHNTDTVAQAVSRGSLIYGNSTPKWDELVKPSVASLLKNNATDASWVTIPTRKIWLPAEAWVNGSGVPAVLGVIGTYPDCYNAWSFDALGTEGIVCNFDTPEDWLSGAITFKVRWATSGAAATNWVPKLRYLIGNDGQDMTAANTLVTGPTTTANVAIHLLNTTTIGTITPGTPQQEIRLVFERAPGGSDTYLGTIRVLGIRAEFTPAY